MELKPQDLFVVYKQAANSDKSWSYAVGALLSERRFGDYPAGLLADNSRTKIVLERLKSLISYVKCSIHLGKPCTGGEDRI
jgi:hypothetical protein